MARGVKFTEGAARRVVAATQAYERGNRDQPPIKFRQTGDDGGFRLGKVGEDWNKGATVTVQEYKGNGEIIEGSEFEAINRFATVPVAEGETVWVACIAIGSTWHLIAAECAAPGGGS